MLKDFWVMEICDIRIGQYRVVFVFGLVLFFVQVVSNVLVLVIMGFGICIYWVVVGENGNYWWLAWFVQFICVVLVDNCVVGENVVQVIWV